MPNTTDGVLARFEDEVYPHRFDKEKEVFLKLYNYSRQGFLNREEMQTLTDVYSDFLSSKGY